MLSLLYMHLQTLLCDDKKRTSHLLRQVLVYKDRGVECVFKLDFGVTLLGSALLESDLTHNGMYL